MTKIKNFRVSLRAREMARWLKKEKGMEGSPDLELAIEGLIKTSVQWVRPAAVYTTLTRRIAEKTTSISLPKEAVAMSLAAVSIGPALEVERQASSLDTQREALLSALLHEALAQAQQFAMRLIAEQAKEEDCEMSPPELVTDEALVSSLASLLGLSRIGIDLGATPPVLPPHSRVCFSFWTPVGKGSSRRAENPGRVEKVAV